jgi:medium-chain acyl-[acyl-carrier-protein] hydrolase
MNMSANTSPPSPWLGPVSRPGHGSRLRLFCFPYAGGGTAGYRGFPAALAGEAEVCPVRLPGREMRLREQSIRSFPEMIDALESALRDYTSEPYAFFGHSMGASLAYELAVRMGERGRPLPRHLFASGRQAPHLMREILSRPVDELSDAELVRDLASVSAANGEVLRDADLAGLMLPILRADFALCQSYRPVERPALPVPITALGGTADANVGRPDLEEWRQQTTARFSLHMIPGDHLFLVSAAAQVCGVVLGKLRGLADNPAA